MKNDKICVRKNLMYLFLISVFAVLFVVTVNFINSQQKGTNSRAAGIDVQQLLAVCQSIKGQVSRVVADYGGAGKPGYDHFNGLYKSTTTPNPLVTPIAAKPLSAYCATYGVMSNVGEAPAAAFTVQQLTANCPTIKGKVSREVPNYGGAGRTGYDHFNGNYYSTTVKTPNVTPIPGKDWSAYCATEGKLSSVGVAPEAVHTVQELIAVCQSIKGQVSRVVADYGGAGKPGYDHFNGLYKSTTTPNPLVTPIAAKPLSAYCATYGVMSNVGEAPEAAGTVGDILAVCQSMKGYMAKVYENYFGAGKNGYTQFTGNYYSTTEKNPQVTSAGNLSDYCMASSIKSNWCAGYIESVCGGTVDPTCFWSEGACVPVRNP